MLKERKATHVMCNFEKESHPNSIGLHKYWKQKIDDFLSCLQRKLESFQNNAITKRVAQSEKKLF